MRYVSLFTLFIIILSGAPIHAAAPCDPASVIASANALKSSGDEQKDLAALKELANAIQNANSNCVSAAEVQPAPAGSGTRKNPVPLGSVLVGATREKATFDIRVSQIIRGDDALAELKKANSGVDDPAKGHEYLLAYVEVNYTAGDEEEAFTLYGIEFTSVSKGQIMDSLLFVLTPEPALNLKGFPGAEAEGWIVVDVNKDDPQPLVFYGSTFSGKGIFFATW